LLRVPAAFLSAVEMSVTGAGVAGVGFYAQVPHHVGAPSAAGTVSLLEHLGRHLQVALPMGSLPDDALQQRARLDAAFQADDDVREILERLESMSDEQLPSGDDLASEIERFLR